MTFSKFKKWLLPILVLLPMAAFWAVCFSHMSDTHYGHGQSEQQRTWERIKDFGIGETIYVLVWSMPWAVVPWAVINQFKNERYQAILLVIYLIFMIKAIINPRWVLEPFFGPGLP